MINAKTLKPVLIIANTPNNVANTPDIIFFLKSITHPYNRLYQTKEPITIKL